MERIERSLWSFIIGDALGLAGEFKARDTYKIETMEGYGSWFVPKGTWSDDSSMMLITAENILLNESLDDLKRKFCDWMYRGYWTYNDEPSMDVGLTVRYMLKQWENDGLDKTSRTDAESNGNGALMRILPLSIATLGDENYEEIVIQNAKLTHGHIRSILCCLHYTDVVHGLLRGKNFGTAYREANEKLDKRLENYEEERVHFENFKNLKFFTRDEIQSTGYVIHTLEAVYWSIFQTDNIKDALLLAVNLGEDTDTIGAITGGLVGMMYDELNVPNDWVDELAKKEKIEEIIKKCQKEWMR